MRSFRLIQAMLVLGSLGLIRCGHFGIDLGDGSVTTSGGSGLTGGVGGNGQVGSGGVGSGAAPPTSGGSGVGTGGLPSTGGAASGGALVFDVSIPGELGEPPGPEAAGAAGASSMPDVPDACVENCVCEVDYCHFGCELSAAATTVCRPNCSETTCFIEPLEVPKVDADCPNGECYVRSGAGPLELALRNHGKYTVDCQSASECQVLCQGGASCEVFCNSSDSTQTCDMTCEGEGSCTLVGSPDSNRNLTCVGSQKYICQNGARCGLSCEVPLGP